ncbi:MAG TPA: NUDIX hydrolase [Ktedonobacterales bacterium]|nr:NUDIX hydrolase [Ktedonobacterales bacterium]
MAGTQHDPPRGQQQADAPGGKPDAPDSPWSTLDTRETYTNPWLTVTEYTVLRPDGMHGIYGVVDPGDNVTIAALDAEERIQMLGEFRYPLQRWQWLLPGGKVEHGEDPLLAAQRELAEETGVWADDWQPLGSYALSSGISSQMSHLFLARSLHQGEARPEGTELHLRTRLMSLREAYAACLSGEISEATSALAIWRAWFVLHDSA